MGTATAALAPTATAMAMQATAPTAAMAMGGGAQATPAPLLLQAPLGMRAALRGGTMGARGAAAEWPLARAAGRMGTGGCMGK